MVNYVFVNIRCSNVNGQRPTRSQTRRRKSYDNQRLQLRGMSGVEYISSLNEEISTGSMSVLEIMVMQTIIMYSILNGVDCTSEAVYQAYSNIFDVSKLCTVDLSLFDRSSGITNTRKIKSMRAVTINCESRFAWPYS